MRAAVLLATALVAGGTALAAGAALLPGSGVPVPRVTDRTNLARRPYQRNTPKPPLEPFPTNAWWSGGALEAWPSPLYAWPLKITLGPHGATVDAPATHAAGRAAYAVERAPLTVAWSTAPDRAQVASHGDFDVTFDVFARRARLGSVTATQGSPFAWFTRGRALPTVTAPAGAETTPLDCKRPCTAARTIAYRGTIYLVAESANILAIAVLAPGTNADAYLPYAFNVAKDTRVSWRTSGASIDTTFTYPAKTLMGLLPHHSDALTGRVRALGAYDTVRGPLAIAEGTSFTIRMPVPEIAPDPPLHDTLKNDVDFLATLRTEVESQNDFGGDTYAAGKKLLRAALLARLADGTDDEALKASALAKAADGLASWCSGRGGRYAFDTRLGGIVGEPTSFGSEHFNDHHFHYGYAIHAAAVVAGLDRGFERRYGDCIDLLVRDIAADRGDRSFPFLRHMDPYAGHSWANGLTRFADGQNQESVSEAAHAWYAVALWGDVTRDRKLGARGRWLLAMETLGAKSYWFNAGETKTLPAGFAHPMASIVWGGKIDYATFFDPSDAAVRGIQFFPATVALRPLLDRAVTSSIIEPAAHGTGLWPNHLRIVLGMTGAAYGVPEGELDAFYSRSYVQNLLATY